MKIGFDIRPLMDANYSGVSEFTKEILSGLLSLDGEDEFRLYYNSLKSVAHRFPVFGQTNVKIVSSKYPNKIFNYAMQKHLRWPKLDRAAGADVFFAPHINFYALSRKCPSILVVHDLSFLRYPEFFSRRKNIWHSQLATEKLVRQFTKVVAISQNTKNDLAELCGLDPNQVEVIHSGISLDYKPIERDSQTSAKVKEKYGLPKRFIMSLGTIEPRKNFQGLIAAFELLLDRNGDLNDVELIIAGGLGWKSDATMTAWKKSKHRDKIRFIGYVDNQDKPALYSSAELFVFPSFYEGFGFPPLEAMACGTPVVSSFASSLPEILEEAAVYIDPFDSADIASAMEQVLNNSRISSTLKEKGFIQASKYDWTKSAEQYLKIIRKIS